MIKDRLAKLRSELEKKEVDALLVSQPKNRFYLSGFDGSDGYLLITAKNSIVATDFRYVEQVKRQSPGLHTIPDYRENGGMVSRTDDRLEHQPTGI